MRRLGVFVKADGEKYDLYYLPEEQLAQAIGPLPEYSGSATVVLELTAKSEDEAIAKLTEALSPGGFYLDSIPED